MQETTGSIQRTPLYITNFHTVRKKSTIYQVESTEKECYRQVHNGSSEISGAVPTTFPSFLGKATRASMF